MNNLKLTKTEAATLERLKSRGQIYFDQCGISTVKALVRLCDKGYAKWSCLDGGSWEIIEDIDNGKKES